MPTKEQSLQYLRNSNAAPREPYLFLRKPEGEEENTSFNQVFSILRRRWGLIASATVLVTTLAIGWTATRTPKYEGKFQILVEPLKTTDSELLVLLSETLKQNVNEITKQNRTELDYQALMEVLKSPKLIMPVVQKLKNSYPEMSYDELVASDVSGKASPDQVGVLHISRVGKGKDQSRVIEVRYRESDPRKVQYVLEQVSLAYQNYSKQEQQTNLRQGIKFVEHQIPKMQLRVNTLQGQMQVFQKKYTLFNPELQGKQLLDRVDELKAQRIDIERGLTETKALSASLQKQLAMSEDNAIAASALSESPQYQQVLTRLRDIETKIAIESARLTDNNPVMQNLREQRRKLLPLVQQEAKLALGSNSSVSTMPNSQVGVYQNSVRRDLIKQLADTANQVKTLESSLEANQKAMAELNQQIQQYPALSRQYGNLQRELQVSTDTLNQILAKQEALRVDAAQQDIPWEIITPPTIPRDKTGKFLPVGLNAERNIVLGVVAGLLLGTLAAFVLENLQNVFHDPEEVKRASKLPLLAVIPFHKELRHSTLATDQKLPHPVPKGKNQFVSTVKAKASEYKKNAFMEVFCSLYSKINSLKSEDSIRSVVVTSATNGDGKSTVAANIAKIAAQAGQKVLLVDANLRHPQVHHALGLVNAKGLSEILSQGIDFKDVVGQAPREENLFVITAGDTPQNPTKLFSSQRMESFVELTHANYDLVVYDAPHLLGLLDTSILANHVDGVLMVVGLGKTVRPFLYQALEELKTSRVSLLGIVADTIER
ncbi:polysaccharide biosynthesis tyrosine autokinase [Brasilonema sp. UFV-L1]|nr:polysaccharide biosynthesis tyrosine autokinase [Brasilonema sp. UFV-L1]NMG06808.1 capsular biosynthesis protein [Brasilonema sp. UFV-L1]